jgi:predicted RNA methylase
MIERNLEINFYGKTKIINLCDNYDNFKVQISKNFSIDLNKMDYIKIFYRDENQNKIYIKNFNDYNILLSKVENHKVLLMEILISAIEDVNKKEENIKYNNNVKNNDINESEIIYESIDEKEKNFSINKKDIIYPVMCSICKNENLKNIIFFCLRCNNYVCSKCFETIKQIHSHSYNIIINKEQFKDINELYNKCKK